MPDNGYDDSWLKGKSQKERVELQLVNMLEELTDTDWSKMPTSIHTHYGEFDFSYLEIDGEGFVQIEAPALPDGWFVLLRDYETWGTPAAWVLRVDNAPWVED